MIRKFRKKDAEECSELILSCINKGNLNKKGKERLRSKNTPKALVSKIKDRDYFVYERKGKLYGIGALRKNEIKTMYVSPKFQGKGIGNTILKHIEKVAKRGKIKKLFLYTHPHSDKFYSKSGFKIIRKFEDRGNKVIYMEKVLG